jgi:hypothetical protein
MMEVTQMGMDAQQLANKKLDGHVLELNILRALVLTILFAEMENGTELQENNVTIMV